MGYNMADAETTEQIEQEEVVSDSAESTPKSRKRVTLKQILPDSRVNKFEQHIQIMKAYAAASDGKKPLRFSDFEGLVDFHVQLVSGMNKFYEYLQLIEPVKGKPGNYVPTQQLLDFVNYLNWKQENEAKRSLRTAVEKSWFWDSARVLLRAKTKASADELMSKFGVESGASPVMHRSALKTLIEYLTYTELIKPTDDGNYQLAENYENASRVDVPVPQTKAPESTERTMHVRPTNKIESESKLGYSIGAHAQLVFNIDSTTDPEKLKACLKIIREVLENGQ